MALARIGEYHQRLLNQCERTLAPTATIRDNDLADVRLLLREDSAAREHLLDFAKGACLLNRGDVIVAKELAVLSVASAIRLLQKDNSCESEADGSKQAGADGSRGERGGGWG